KVDSNGIQRKSNLFDLLLLAGLFAVGVLVFLVLCGAAWAQGDDFPGVPIVNPGFPPQPLPGSPPNPQYSSGEWRTKGQTFKLWEVKKGDRVYIDQVMDCVGCYWRLAVAWIMPAVQGAQDLRLEYPEGVNNINQWGHGNAGGWCIHCLWSFTAGDDYPEVALVYYGSGDFWAQLVVVGVVPAPQPARSLYTQEQKDNARWWQSTSGTARDYLNAAAIGFCATGNNVGLCLGSSIAEFLAAKIGDHYGNRAADPPDSDYQSLFQPQVPYLWGLWGVWPFDQLMAGGEIVIGYLEAANITINRASTCLANNDSCVWTQLEHLRQLQQIAGWWMQYAENCLEIIRDQEGGDDGFNWGISVIGAAGYNLQYQW